MKISFYAFVLLFFISCKDQDQKSSEKAPENRNIAPVLSVPENIEEAHNKVAFMEQEAIAFDIDLSFNGNSRLNATISMLANSSRIKLEKKDGTVLIFDGEKVFQQSGDLIDTGARFDIFTWPYFFALPFKLTDPGTMWEEKPDRDMEGQNYHTARLTFQSQIGDSPDDWYLIYQDPETLRLKAAAYIVTFNRAAEEAEKSPHIIVYENYKMIKQVPFPQKWHFHNWSAENGLGEKLGEATISNVHFFMPEKDFFSVSQDAKEVAR
ncbi:DUF6503 family protein [Christiangramia flava]|uniref:Uncharacterized protein n=1 Tax=Christiangramia flava JLT2011 TaxID=1229726 RepID=A0A1L7I6I4_9FLAO|nr:DUF6503 family protein [Christiangramia flava]APU69196.1 hypothetical protein GRFL_2472 [Christiangramia flava JLT2011]OSS38904.1 hypothetical protein C723_2295 [Christiangramia flava JLT2011]